MQAMRVYGKQDFRLEDIEEPQTGRVAPITCGHKFSADVTDVGAAVSGIAPGALGLD